MTFMKYLSVAQISKEWNLSERSVRNYCAHSRIEGAYLLGKTWRIPETAKKPERKNKKKNINALLDTLLLEKSKHFSGGIYHKTQIDLTHREQEIPQPL